MSDLTKLKEILDHQSPKGIKSGDWKALEYLQEKDEDNYIKLRIESLEVGFLFSPRGRLVGMYNWKD